MVSGVENGSNDGSSGTRGHICWLRQMWGSSVHQRGEVVCVMSVGR